jgi:hypothetical protein
MFHGTLAKWLKEKGRKAGAFRPEFVKNISVWFRKNPGEF